MLVTLTAENRGFGLKVQIKTASRLGLLPPYLFAELDRLKKEVAAKGVDVISLGIGDPDLRHHDISWRASSARPTTEESSLSRLRRLRRNIAEAAAQWYRAPLRRQLRPSREVCALIGSKEGIANFSTAVVDPGDIVLIPDPGYPVYYSGCVFNGGEPYFLPLKKENGFVPDLASIPAEVARRAKMLWLNYPNNPTGATVDSCVLRQTRSNSASSTTSFSRTTAPIPKSPTTAIARRAFSRSKAPANARSSSIRCRKLSR